MRYNKYNVRNTCQYNNSGQFVSAGELVLGPAQGIRQPVATSQPRQQQSQYGNIGQSPQPVQPPRPVQPPQPGPNTTTSQAGQPLPPPPMSPAITQEVPEINENKNVEANIETDSIGNSEDGSGRQHWMKSKLTGVKKISNKERRRRQNESLRRLLTPKNALMVLNEMLPNEQLATQFKVEPTASSMQYFKPHSFVADLCLEGQNYKGFGDNKLMARNAAAEQAIRDLIIKKMTKVFNAEVSSDSESGTTEEETLPMIQLASFALHKLFYEWEVGGYKVPQLRPANSAANSAANSTSNNAANSTASGATERASSPQVRAVRAPKRPKELPQNAALMHPCMLLTYMRPSLEYRELASHGDRPQNMLYTIGIDVDGSTYIGKAQNKKEARKAAARAACKNIFGVEFQN